MKLSEINQLNLMIFCVKVGWKNKDLSPASKAKLMEKLISHQRDQWVEQPAK